MGDDTCCIDKSSSAKLTDDINSTFQWYASVAACCVCVADLNRGGSCRIVDGEESSQFVQSHPLLVHKGVDAAGINGAKSPRQVEEEDIGIYLTRYGGSIYSIYRKYVGNIAYSLGANPKNLQPPRRKRGEGHTACQRLPSALARY
jgi:hypothetical protein